MSYSRFTIEQQGHVAIVRFSRTDKRNAMDAETWHELKTVFETLSNEGKVRCAIIASEGKHFCTGMDLAVFQDSSKLFASEEPGRQGEYFRHLVAYLQACISAVEAARFPVIAAVQGGCIGAGFDLISACDIRLSTDDAWFQIAETNIGMTADVGTLQRVGSVMPAGLARELCYTGRRLTASEARTSGYLNQTFESHQELLAGALEMAQVIAAKSPMSVTGCKHLLNYSRDHSVADSLHYQTLWQAAHFHYRDMTEAAFAAFEKREANFEALPAINPQKDFN